MVLRLGVDLAGADVAPLEIFHAVQETVQQDPDLHCTLFCTPEIAALLPPFSRQITTHVSSQYIHMDEEPLKGLRTKREATVLKGIQELHKKNIDAFISCSNTGALIGASALFLSRLPGIHRPGLLALLPSKQQPFAVIDVGGLVMPRVKHLVQFAFVGAAFQAVYGNMAKPRVALLNVGAESLKGTQEVREAWKVLSSIKEDLFTFIGNVEGKTIFEGGVDVVVTSGFTGNVFLKTAEGIAAFATEMIEAYISHWATQEIKELFTAVHEHLSYEESFGAVVAGVEELVIKCHGSSSHKAICNAVIGAKSLLLKKVTSHMSQSLSKSTAHSFFRAI